MAVKSHMELAPGLKVAAQMSPEPSDDGRLGTAYTLAYMRALQKRAEEEVD